MTSKKKIETKVKKDPNRRTTNHIIHFALPIRPSYATQGIVVELGELQPFTTYY